jgi:hypothetical protein
MRPKPLIPTFTAMGPILLRGRYGQQLNKAREFVASGMIQKGESTKPLIVSFEASKEC